MFGQDAKIFRQAFMLTKGHKTFWRLGLLLAWPTAGKACFYLLAISWLSSPSLEPFTIAPAVLPQGNALAGLVIAGILVVLLLAYYRSKAVLYWTVSHLRGHGAIDKAEIVDRAEPHTIRLLKVGVLFALASAVGFLAFSGPVMYLFSRQNPAQAAALSVLALAVALPAALVLYLASILVPKFMCLYGMPAAHGLRAALDMVRRMWPGLAWFTALVWLLEALGMALSILAGTAAFWLFVLLFRIFYDMYAFAGPELAQGLAGLAGFMVFFISLAWVSAFQKISWTVLFLETARPIQSDEEPVEEPVPETAA